MWFVYLDKINKKIHLQLSEVNDENLLLMISGDNLDGILMFCCGAVLMSRLCGTQVNNSIKEFADKVSSNVNVIN